MITETRGVAAQALGEAQPDDDLGSDFPLEHSSLSAAASTARSFYSLAPLSCSERTAIERGNGGPSPPRAWKDMVGRQRTRWE